jgi:homoserine O-succinyltransferase/O-acetyltransferase
MFALMYPDKIVRVAILDLYEAEPNQGMRCLREILDQYAQKNGLGLIRDEFEVRIKKQVPDLSYDIYISTGGPGSPIDSEDSDWENNYFRWVKQIENHNQKAKGKEKKCVLFICHSFQLACRYFKVANVTKRRSTAFGVFPVHLQSKGMAEPVFEGLDDPFYAVDSRDYQVIQPDADRLENLGANILAIEKERPHIPLERAIMAIRFNEEMIGTQFHPEADASGMSMYLQREDKMNMVIAEYGEEKWRSMVEQLNDPDKIKWTYSHVIPNFLDLAIDLKH